MVGLRYILPIIAVTLMAESGYAQWKIVIDPKTIEQVGINMASQKAIEYEHNKRLDTSFLCFEAMVSDLKSTRLNSSHWS